MGRIASFHLVRESWLAGAVGDGSTRHRSDPSRPRPGPRVLAAARHGPGRRHRDGRRPAPHRVVRRLGRRVRPRRVPRARTRSVDGGADADGLGTSGFASLGGHGTWRGINPLDGLDTGTSARGPIAMLTRANVRPSAWRSRRSRRPGRRPRTAPRRGVDRRGRDRRSTDRPGSRRSACGTPPASARRFAYSMPDHVDVVERHSRRRVVLRRTVRTLRALRTDEAAGTPATHSTPPQFPKLPRRKVAITATPAGNFRGSSELLEAQEGPDQHECGRRVIDAHASGQFRSGCGECLAR